MVREAVIVLFVAMASRDAVAILQDPFHSKTYDPFNRNPSQWDVDQARRTAQNESQLVSQERRRQLDSKTSGEWFDSVHRAQEHQRHQWQAENDARMLEGQMWRNRIQEENRIQAENRRRWELEQEQRERSRRQQEEENRAQEENRRRWAWEREQRERSRRQQGGVQHEIERRQVQDNRTEWGGQRIETSQQRSESIRDSIARLEAIDKRARRGVRYKGTISPLERVAIEKEDNARRELIAYLRSSLRKEEQAERDAKGRTQQSKNARLEKPRRKGGGR